jgi:hypothetical protein
MACHSVFVNPFLSTALDSENQRAPVGSAIFGGCGAILVTLRWAGIFPARRKADRLE